MLRRPSPHLQAVLLALLVTLLWSSSWVLIKIGLADIPALPFAGLRYTLAFLCLLPFALRPGERASLRGLGAGTWARLVALGLLFYSVTQGAQFLSLFYLPAVTTSLLLSSTPILVALLGIMLLGERPTGVQWSGTALFLFGVVVFLYPVSLPNQEKLGLVVALVGVVSNALSAILGRDVNRRGDLSAMTVTVVSMGFGALVLLVIGILAQGWPRLTLTHWAIIVWLAAVNSALAFTLWNHSLRTLRAMESSIINNTMLFQIALLASLFLDEPLGWRQGAGLALAVVGTLLVQLRRLRVQRPGRQCSDQPAAAAHPARRSTGSPSRQRGPAETQTPPG